MKRALLLTGLVVAACSDDVAAPGEFQAAALPAQLTTICQPHANGGSGITLADGKGAAASAAAQDQLGPCPPRVMVTETPILITPSVSTFWCPGGGLLYEATFEWEPARDPQNLVATYNLGLFEANSFTIVWAITTPVHTFRTCGYMWPHQRTGWSLRVQAVDLHGRRGAWSDSVPVAFSGWAGSVPFPLDRDRQVYGHFPRVTTATWTDVSGASAYWIEWQYCGYSPWGWDGCQGWSTLYSRLVAGMTDTIEFVGAQAGRWRVRAFVSGAWGAWSDYIYFRYTV